MEPELPHRDLVLPHRVLPHRDLEPEPSILYVLLHRPGASTGYPPRPRTPRANQYDAVRRLVGDRN